MSKAGRSAGSPHGFGHAQETSGDLLKMVKMCLVDKWRGTGRGNAKHVKHVQPARLQELEAPRGSIARLPACALAYPRNGILNTWKC